MPENLLETIPKADITSIAKIIVALSVRCAEKYPFVTVDDCIQEGWKELIRYQSYYDSTCGTKVTTWAYTVVYGALISYAQKEFNKTNKWDNIEDFTDLDDNSHPIDATCVHIDFLEILRVIASPKCKQCLAILEADPKITIEDLSLRLGLCERDTIHVKNELRGLTRYLVER